MQLEIALLGNPNCGKTTLFHALTGAGGPVGNWAGVTVTAEQGSFMFGETEIKLIDLPGVYSLTSVSPEQKAVDAYLSTAKPDVIINVANSTNLERHLYLTTQLLEKKIPMVLCLNLWDELPRLGLTLDVERLRDELGIPCIPCSAAKGQGLSSLLQAACQATNNPPSALPLDIALSAVARFDQVAQLMEKVAIPTKQQKEGPGLDRFFCHPFWALPIFSLLMLTMFYLSFGPLGAALSDVFSLWLTYAEEGVHTLLLHFSVQPFVQSLLLDGIFSGIGSVLVFLPQLLLMFLFLALLETSGYMARTAFLADRYLSKVGLSGFSMIPLLLGFGCSVPAVMACRSLDSWRDRLLTMTAIPFVSCSARLPVYAFFTAAFFPEHSWLIIGGLYFGGLFFGALVLRLLDKTMLVKEKTCFILELPPYRWPAFRALFRSIQVRVWDYISKAGSVIFLASVLVWVLSNLTPTMTPTSDASTSILGCMGVWVANLLQPLGLGRWELAVALIAGLFSKEAIVSTFSILLGSTGALPTLLSHSAALAFLTFVLLYTPCVATLRIMAAESGSKWFVLRIALAHLLFAWIVAFVVSWLAGWAGFLLI